MSTWPEVINRANSDPAFRDKLKSNPMATCKEFGCNVPAGSTVDVIEQQPGDLHLFLGSKTGDSKLDALLEKAQRDPACKQQLLANPRSLVETAVGQKLPAEATIRIHERTPNRIRIFLGSDSAADGELSDRALEAVAGGGLWANIWCKNEIRKVTDNVAGTFTNEINRSSGFVDNGSTAF